MKAEVMCPQHLRWSEFCERLKQEYLTEIDLKPHDEPDPIAATMLRSMGFNDFSIEASLSYLRSLGGVCDCQILIKVAGIGVEESANAE